MAVLTLWEVKAYLNVTDGDDDDDLSAVIDRAEASLTSRTGPLEPVTVTARVRGWGYMLSPKVTPILSLTSVTPVGASALNTSLMVLPENGLRGPKCVEMMDGTPFTERWYDVVYQAGRDACPEDLRGVLLDLAKFYWEPQLGAAPPGQGALPSDADSLPVYVPNNSFPWSRVQHVVEPHEQVWL